MKFMKILFLAIIVLTFGSCEKLPDSPPNDKIPKVEFLQPGPNQGNDTFVQSNLRFQNKNFGSQSSLESWTWTDNVNGSPSYNSRILINFPELNLMTNDQIDSIKLTLYSAENFPYANGGQYGPNANYVFCVTQDWDQSTVTWNTQPAYDDSSCIFIPTNDDYDSIVVNLTPLISKEMNLGYGFIFMQQNKFPYSSSVFCSSNDNIVSKRPKLTIYYK